MKRNLLCLIVLWISVWAAAQPINGIRIESRNQEMVVFLNGNQVSLPAFSCFIANLSEGRYQVEVYAADSRGYNRGKLLFKKQLYYRGYTEDIVIGHQNPPLGYEPSYCLNIMSPAEFKEFYAHFKREPFESGRAALLNSVLLTSGFTVQQSLELVNLLPFDKEKINVIKKLYPNIVDKQNSYLLLDALTFQSGKKELSDYFKEVLSGRDR